MQRLAVEWMQNSNATWNERCSQAKCSTCIKDIQVRSVATVTSAFYVIN